MWHESAPPTGAARVVYRLLAEASSGFCKGTWGGNEEAAALGRKASAARQLPGRGQGISRQGRRDDDVRNRGALTGH